MEIQVKINSTPFLLACCGPRLFLGLPYFIFKCRLQSLFLNFNFQNLLIRAGNLMLHAQRLQIPDKYFSFLRAKIQVFDELLKFIFVSKTTR